MARLSPPEVVGLGTLARTLDLARVRVHRGDDAGAAARWLRRAVLALSRGRAVALGNHVFLPERAARDLAVLAHELTHCLQYQRWGAARYFRRGAAERLRELVHRLTGLGPDPYAYSPDAAVPFDAYGMEQQGQIVEDCFRGDERAATISPFRPPAGAAPGAAAGAVRGRPARADRG